LGITAALGRTTAKMHRSLASRPDLAAFAPEHASAADRQAEAERMLAHATHVFSLAEARLPSLPPAVATATGHLLARRDAIAAALGRLAAVEPWGALIRIHGDYHLGQVLVRPPGPELLVIDFEGEPGRSLADRRRKTTAAKDVAGMCRSFDYLLRHAARVGSMGYDAAHLRLLEASYLAAYRAVAAGQPWWPAEERAADALLSIYKLDKALYELAYELRNRPDWVEVPLGALMSCGV
ncbi:MAG: phosphotransferase, partial [Planctomycetia bacterium]